MISLPVLLLTGGLSVAVAAVAAVALAALPHRADERTRSTEGGANP